MAPVAGTAAMPAPTGSTPRIPVKVGECPMIKTGMITVLDQKVQLWVGAKQEGKSGPIVFYWHGTGSSATEAVSGLGPGHSEIMAQGGVIASFTTTTQKGMNTGNNVWYTGDFEMADQILACAIEQQGVDPRRVYTAGCSAGGLQASAMVYGRSSYLAAAMPNSGGTTFRYQLEDPSHVPALITTHGAMGRDVVGVDFSKTSATQTKDLAAKRGMVVNCDHGGGHCLSPPNVKAAQWEFLKSHPFGVMPDPYEAGLPASFPAVCKIIK
jgi:poly(3-hydroxybutyrate) depolymerase